MSAEHTPERLDFAEGKYTVINDNGTLTALRYGEPWGRDLVGDNLVYWMFCEVRDLKKERDDAIRALKGAQLGMRANFIAMQQQAALKCELLAALRWTTHCLQWHVAQHPAAMDAKVLEDAKATIAKVEGGDL